MNKKIASALLGVLLIGIVTAGLVPYLSNIVSGSVEVNGPVFYAAPGGLLLVNEESTEHETLTIKDSESIIFWTEENLGGIDFNYIPKLDLYVKVKVNSPPKSLELIFGYSNTSGDAHNICSLDIDITTSSLNDYHTSCEGSETLTNVNEFFYKMQGKGDTTVEYEISTLNTKVEMSKAT
ncbi:MAG: hypothetical protein IIA85_01040 [Nanoarchaeota archaeon]|nr:hypothetical protein [Nanoarchaeota archaeon]